MKQIYNPYLPLNVYIPDGEPHIFGDRLYVYGSHDKEGGDTFCMLDYEVFSAPLDDLTDWKSEGIIYCANQDPDYSEKYKYMYAPDVVQGNDGRFYLYYALAGGCFTGPIHVAVSDFPAGKYDYYGCVRHKDGSAWKRNITFDPSVMNDDGVIRLYYGWSLAAENNKLTTEELGEKLIEVQMMMFEKTREEVLGEPQGVMGAFAVQLENDMLTVKTEPVRIVPGQFDAANTGFAGHAFFEASSIRKIKDTYYFVYSSQVSHELCYATSKHPDRDFTYGGVIISNGDIGFNGRKPQERLAMTGNNHGGLVCIYDQWYIFYHRQTHKTAFSRQGCAEKIEIRPDGKILQVEMTSCGLNHGALIAQGEFPAVIACNITNGHMPHTQMTLCESDVPYITHEKNERFITDITDGTMIGYKYFECPEMVNLGLMMCGDGNGDFEIWNETQKIGTICVEPSSVWVNKKTLLKSGGRQALYLKYRGTGHVKLLKLTFDKEMLEDAHT